MMSNVHNVRALAGTTLTAFLLAGVVACDGDSKNNEVSPADLPYSEWTRGDEVPANGPECFGARGTAADGTKLVAALRLRRNDSGVAGSYTVGTSADAVTSYAFAGPLRGETFEVQFKNAGNQLSVRGSITAAGVELNDPSRSLPLTKLIVGCA